MGPHDCHPCYFGIASFELHSTLGVLCTSIYNYKHVHAYHVSYSENITLYIISSNDISLVDCLLLKRPSNEIKKHLNC